MAGPLRLDAVGGDPGRPSTIEFDFWGWALAKLPRSRSPGAPVRGLLGRRPAVTAGERHRGSARRPACLGPRVVVVGGGVVGASTSPTTWLTSAGPTCSCSSRAPCPAARRGTPPVSSGCCAPARRHPARPALGRPLPAARGRDRARHGLPAVRRRSSWPHPEHAGGPASHRRDRCRLRPRVRAADAAEQAGSATPSCAPRTSPGPSGSRATAPPTPPTYPVAAKGHASSGAGA